MNMKKKLIAVAVLVLTMALIFTACAPSNKAGDDEMKETILLYDFDGNAVDIFADGKPVYLKVWASWCPSCLEGLDELDALFAEDPQDFKLVTIVTPELSGEMNEADFKVWLGGLEQQNIEVLFDRDAAMVQDLGIRAFPTSVYFNSNGSAVGMRVGHNENDFIKETMAKVK